MDTSAALIVPMLAGVVHPTCRLACDSSAYWPAGKIKGCQLVQGDVAPREDWAGLMNEWIKNRSGRERNQSRPAHPDKRNRPPIINPCGLNCPSQSGRREYREAMIKIEGRPLAALVVNRHDWNGTEAYEFGMAKSGSSRDSFFCYPDMNAKDYLTPADIKIPAAETHHINAALAGIRVDQAAERLTGYFKGTIVFTPDLDATRMALSQLFEGNIPDALRTGENGNAGLYLLDDALDLFFESNQVSPEAAERASDAALFQTFRSVEARDRASALIAMVERMQNAVGFDR